MRAQTILPFKSGDWRSGDEAAEMLRHGLVVALALSFFALYGAALLGWLRPLSDLTLVGRLEPVILLFIGYYLGGLPSRRAERAAKDEIERMEARLDVVQLRKDEVQSERDLLAEKIRNARIALGRTPLSQRPDPLAGGAVQETERDERKNGNLGTGTPADIVRRILDS